jgi:membrane-associated phospholipid phosphatase
MHGRRADSAHMGRTAIVATLLLGLFLALTAAVLVHQAPFAAERWWAGVVSAHRGRPLTAVALAFNATGLLPWSLLIVGLATLAVWRARVVAGVATLLAGEAASWTIATLTKLGVGRPRPLDGLVATSSSSFPSGHTAFATVTAVLLVGLLCSRERRGAWAAWAALAAVAALAMAWSRTYLTAHWLADVSGGLALGAAAGLGALAWRRWRLRRAGVAEPPDHERKVPTCR